MLFYIQPKITLTEATYFLKIYFHMSFQGPVLIGSRVTVAWKMVHHFCYYELQEIEKYEICTLLGYYTASYGKQLPHNIL